MAVKRSWKRSDFVIYSYLKDSVFTAASPNKTLLSTPTSGTSHQKPTVDVYKTRVDHLIS